MAKYSAPLAAGFLILFMLSTNFHSPEDATLRVAFLGSGGADSYDPAKIHFTNEYIFLESIYSPLVELSDDKGTPVSSVAREYYWEGSDLHFVIRDDLETIDGHKIDVKDVVVSLKRLLILSENTHGDFKKLVCPDIELKTLEQDCPRMVVKENVLILKLAAYRDFLIPMLASIDFAIIPRTSIDTKTLKIIDYRNTSGPYYVEKDEGAGKITLKANPKHFHFNEKMAGEVVLVPTHGMGRDQIIDGYNGGTFDHITTVHGLSLEELERVDTSESNIHRTIPIKTEIAFITDKGKKRIPPERRLAFAKSLQKSFHDYYRGKDGYKVIEQFFLPLGNQKFSQEEENLLERAFAEVAMEQSGEGIRLGIFKSHPKVLQEYEGVSKTYMPDLEVVQAKGIPAFSRLPDEEIPDYLLVVTDSGFQEDISLLTYTVSLGALGLSAEEGKAWLADYMDMEDKRERLAKLKQMHLKSLTEGLMIPLASAPCLAVARRPWTPRLSQLFANNPLWKVRRN